MITDEVEVLRIARRTNSRMTQRPFIINNKVALNLTYIINQAIFTILFIPLLLSVILCIS
jgi:hypothetical protein